MRSKNANYETAIFIYVQFKKNQPNMKKQVFLSLIAILAVFQGIAQYSVFKGCPVTVDFSNKLRT